jgi:hypothetical protein
MPVEQLSLFLSGETYEMYQHMFQAKAKLNELTNVAAPERRPTQQQTGSIYFSAPFDTYVASEDAISEQSEPVEAECHGR